MHSEIVSVCNKSYNQYFYITDILPIPATDMYMQRSRKFFFVCSCNGINCVGGDFIMFATTLLLWKRKSVSYSTANVLLVGFLQKGSNNCMDH